MVLVLFCALFQDFTSDTSDDWSLTLSGFDFGMGIADTTVEGQVFVQVGFESLPVSLLDGPKPAPDFSSSQLKILELGSHFGKNLLIGMNS